MRPLVSQRILNDVIDALADYEAIDVAMPATDTIIQTDGDFIESDSRPQPVEARTRRRRHSASKRYGRLTI